MKNNFRNALLFSSCILILYSCKKNQNHEAIDNRLKDSIGRISSIIELFNVKKVELDTDASLLNGIIFGIGTGDEDDNLYLIGENQEVYKIDSTGTFRKKLFRIGNGPGEYSQIGNIAVNEMGDIFIDDYSHGRILIYDSTFQYVNYFKRRTSSLSSFTDMKFIDKNTLIGLSVLDNDYALYKYNTATYDLISKCGSPDERAFKYSSYMNMGGIDYDGKNVFYIKPHYYQIYRDNDCSEEELIAATGRSFSAINKKVRTVFVPHYDYSILNRFYAEKNFFMVKYLINGAGHKNYDIIDKNGNILKENVPLNFNHENILIKYSQGKYFTLNYKQEPGGAIKLIIYYLKLKKEYM